MKKTITLVYHNLRCGGVEKEILSYIKNLDKSSNEIHLLLTQKKGELIIDVPEFVQIHELGGDSVKPNLTYLAGLYKRLHDIKPHIVIGFMQDISLSIGILKLFGLISSKFIISEQVVLSAWQKVKQTSLLKRILVATVYRIADAIFAQSESIEEDLKMNLSLCAKRITLIPSHIILNHRTNIKTTWKEKNYFLYVGRLDPEKNIDTLFTAIKLASKLNSSVKLVVVGKPNIKYTSLAADHGISNIVKFVGYQKNVFPFYNNALALIIPSRVEGRSRIMIEAMYSNCLVISSDFPGHNRYINNQVNGIVFPKHSATELASILVSIRNQKNSHCKKLITNAKTFITQTHINRYNKKYYAILNNALDNLFLNT